MPTVNTRDNPRVPCGQLRLACKSLAVIHLAALLLSSVAWATIMQTTLKCTVEDNTKNKIQMILSIDDDLWSLGFGTAKIEKTYVGVRLEPKHILLNASEYWSPGAVLQIDRTTLAIALREIDRPGTKLSGLCEKTTFAPLKKL